MKPALTAEEWARERKSFENRTPKKRRGMIEFSDIKLLEYTDEKGVHNGLHVYGKGLLCNVNAPNLPALAALCLHEQPFGFTQADATMHRDAAHACITSGQTIGPGSMHEWHISMAERLEALLPPEDTTFTDCKFI